MLQPAISRHVGETQHMKCKIVEKHLYVFFLLQAYTVQNQYGIPHSEVRAVDVLVLVPYFQ